MFPYIMMTVVSTFFAFLYYASCKGNHKRLANTMLFLSFSSLFIFSAIRYDVFNDYLYTYVPGYYEIISGLNTHFEPLFILLNKFVYYVFNNVDWLFILTSFIFIFFVGKTLKEKSAILPLSIFLFIGSRMYFYSFDQIRQYIGISIFLYNLKNIEKGNFKKFIILTIVSGLFHKLSFIYIPIYFVRYIKLTKKKYIIAILSIILLAPIYTRIFNLVAMHFYPNYFNYGSLISGERINNSITMVAFIATNILLSVLYYTKLTYEPYYRIILNIQLVLLFVTLGTWNLFDSYRIVSMFLYTLILLIPKIISIEKNRFIKLMLLFIIVLLNCISGYAFIKNASKLHPYRTIFEK